METILITPQIAKDWLAQNTLNRPIKDSHVRNLAADMVSGRWRQKTGETIKFAKTGELLDGQHRLLAVIAANRSFRFDVVRDLDKSVIDVIDSGVKRTAGDVLSMKNVESSNNVAAIIKSFMSNSLGQSASSVGTSNRMIEEEYFRDPEFWSNVTRRSCTWYKNFRAISPTLFGFSYASVLKNSHNVTKAVEFFDGLSSGRDCAGIIIEARNKFINNLASDKKFSSEFKINLIRSYWNAYVKGRKTNRDEKTEGWL